MEMLQHFSTTKCVGTFKLEAHNSLINEIVTEQFWFKTFETQPSIKKFIKNLTQKNENETERNIRKSSSLNWSLNDLPN